MYFIIRFDWNELDSARSNDRIVGCFDTPTNARKAITNLPYDLYRNAVAIVHFPKNEIYSCAEPDEVFLYDETSTKYRITYQPYIGNQYFYM